MELLNTQYSHNVRYQVAKNQIESLFLKWISHPATNKFVHQLIGQVNQPTQQLTAPPSPIFISNIQAKNSPKQTPPRSPSGEKYMGRTLSPKQTSQLLDSKPQSLHADDIHPSSYDSPNSKALFSKTDTEAVSKLVKNVEMNKQRLQAPEVLQAKKSPQQKVQQAQQPQVQQQPTPVQQPRVDVPKFYFPEGKPIDAEQQKTNDELIEKCFPPTQLELKKEDFEQVTTEVCGLPKFFKSLLFDRIDKTQTGKVSKAQFVQYWKKEMEKQDLKKRMFKIIAQPGNDTISSEDFKPLFRSLLDSHPGLEFLQATPEFQDRYSDTVVMRIFYHVDSNDDGKITFRDFKQSNLKDVFFNVAAEEDINKVREYFSYEHFYVLYCRFWELDSDHDFMIDKEDFSRYEGHALSRKAVDRIFEQVPRKFKSGIKDKMSYEDFVWFMLSEEDKTTHRSLRYWFSIIDLDNNDIITPHEMEYFYEEQVHRLEYLNHEPILFVDLLCQMNDMIRPSHEGHFNFEELRKYNTQVGIFFNCLVNLNKFIAYETRDLFAIKHQQTEYPNYSEWDKFAKGEYERLAMEEENGEDSEMLDAMEGWDSDQDDQANSTQASKENASANAGTGVVNQSQAAEGRALAGGQQVHKLNAA